MTKAEKILIIKALHLFNEDDGWHEAVSILRKMIGNPVKLEPVGVSIPVQDIFKCRKCGRKNNNHKKTCPYMVELHSKGNK